MRGRREARAPQIRLAAVLREMPSSDARKNHRQRPQSLLHLPQNPAIQGDASRSENDRSDRWRGARRVLRMKSRFTEKRLNRSAYRVRCRHCERRHTFDRHPSQYLRSLTCDSCGARDSTRDDGWRVDWYRSVKAESRRRGVCWCKAAKHPHRPGYGAIDSMSGHRIPCS